MKRRFVVRYCYDGDSLDEPGRKKRTHTWDVVDTSRRGTEDGYYHVVCNVDTRAQARAETAALNASGDPHAEGAHAEVASVEQWVEDNCPAFL